MLNIHWPSTVQKIKVLPLLMAAILEICKLGTFHPQEFRGTYPQSIYMVFWSSLPIFICVPKISCLKLIFTPLSIETTHHSLFECEICQKVWEIVSNVRKIRIIWKHIVCGNDQIICYNTISLIAYIIFKYKWFITFKHGNMQILNYVKLQLVRFYDTLCHATRSEGEILFIKNIIACKDKAM